jgi:hypothetical protein
LTETLLEIFTIASSALPILPSSSTTVPSRSPSLNITDTQTSTRLAGGGSAFAPRHHQLADFEEYELADYAGIQDRRRRDTRYFEREAKRAEKIGQLDEADEMKFSHSIQFNAVPDWSSHYIAYSNLKKLYVPSEAWVQAQSCPEYLTDV